MRGLIVAHVVLVVAFAVVCGACSEEASGSDVQRTAATHFRRSTSYPQVTHNGGSPGFVEAAPASLARASR